MADDEPRDEVKPSSGKDGGNKPQHVPYASARSDDKEAGYFTLYKRGQGYWTRMGTVGGAVLIGIFTAYNIYVHVPTFLPESVPLAVGRKIAAGLVVLFCVAYAWGGWILLNKPSNVDFLIATDSEMKKVNWTSKSELIGSTKIVIIFMFLVAIFLFAIDQIFGWLMFWIHVLKVSPLG